MPDGLIEHKQALRARMRALRHTAAAERPDAALRVAGHVLAAWNLPSGTVVAGYRAFRDELDPEPLLLALHRRGHPIALPRVTGAGAPLCFHAWHPGTALCTNGMGIAEPSPDAPVLVPDAILVPLLAFDPARRRLGYGGGYYDRTLAMLKPARAIGLAYSRQMVAAVPCAPHDVALDAIVTENGAI